MSSPQHTPGPWRLKMTSSDWFKPLANGQFVDLRDAANARLIAAAPELLEALEAALHNDGGYHAWKEQARAAIAKATGK